MIIKNYKIIDHLYLENDKLADYDELDLNDSHILELLKHQKRINIIFNNNDSVSNINECINELCYLIEKCPNLEYFRIFSTNLESLNVNVNKLINVALKHNIKQINIRGFNYEYNSLYNEVSSIKTNTIVKLDKIDNIENGLDYLFSKEDVRKHLQFENLGSKELNRIYHDLRIGRISLKDYQKYKDRLSNYHDFYIMINTVADIDSTILNSLKQDTHLKGIYIKCGFQHGEEVQCYSFNEFERIRKEIDEIIKKVKLPKENDLNKEIKIFSQLYSILGKNIDYDYYAVSEGIDDEELNQNCRNLKNGLLGVRRNNKNERLAVCAGYATILQNICACFGIKCDFISSKSKIVDGKEFSTGPRLRENGTTDPMGHAYNAVYLDGKAYFCDLTWDASSMQLDNLADHFLKSYDEFYKSHRKCGFSSDNVDIIDQNGLESHLLDPKVFNNSCSYKQQLELMGNVAKGNIDEMISEGYLANFALNNIEYIKQVKGSVGMKEYLSLIKLIHMVEEYIKSDSFKKSVSWLAKAIPNTIYDSNGNVIGQKDFIFYPGMYEQRPDEVINEVLDMEEKQWKM